uniref:Uncharacterized protein n=1 Tax=Aegilops tauschii subsp. strangulata TaxID=200361 RepID=A0A452XCM2_AEGTS
MCVCGWGGQIVKNVIPICSYIYMVNLMPKHDYVSVLEHGTCWFLLPSKIATCKQPVVNCGKLFVCAVIVAECAEFSPLTGVSVE